jgi:hypothetical protein
VNGSVSGSSPMAGFRSAFGVIMTLSVAHNNVSNKWPVFIKTAFHDNHSKSLY